MNLEFLLWITGACFSLCYIPQIIKSYKTKSVEDLSLSMWILCIIAYICGLIYFVVNWKLSMIFNYGPGIVANLLILYAYARYKKPRGD